MVKLIGSLAVALAAGFSAGLLLHVVFGSELVSWLGAGLMFGASLTILRS